MDYIFYNYGHLSSKSKGEFYQMLRKYTINKLRKYVIIKDHEQNKPTSMLVSVNRSELVNKV